MRVCLIHGSAQSPHGWDLLVHELMAWGVSVFAVDLPLTRTKQGADFFAREVARQLPKGTPPVVVGHEAAGLVLPIVSSYMDVAHLIYLAAMIPIPGVNVGHIDESPSVRLFHDCDERISRWALTTLRPGLSPELLNERCPLLRHRPVPTTYISATQDRVIDPKWWQRAAERELGVKPILIDSGHAPHVSRPHQVARLIMAAGGYASALPSI